MERTPPNASVIFNNPHRTHPTKVYPSLAMILTERTHKPNTPLSPSAICFLCNRINSTSTSTMSVCRTAVHHKHQAADGRYAKQAATIMSLR